MERSSREVILRSVLSSWRRPGIMFFLLILSLAPSAAKQQPAAEYLLMQNVSRLLVYNKYQQKSTPQERSAFVPFVPIKILQMHATLNDNYTPCMQVEVAGTLFYLIKNDKSSLIGAEKPGFEQVFQNVPMVHDTIQLLQGHEVILLSPDRRHQSHLKSRSEIARYFLDGDWVYVRVLGSSPSYGWVRYSESTEAAAKLREKKIPVSIKSLAPSVVTRINQKFYEANSALSKLFMFFNRKGQQKKVIPQWRSLSSEHSIAYKLDPDVYARSFSESDQYLTRELENILLGTPFSVFYTPGRIHIRPKYLEAFPYP